MGLVDLVVGPRARAPPWLPVGETALGPGAGRLVGGVGDLLGPPLVAGGAGRIGPGAEGPPGGGAGPGPEAPGPLGGVDIADGDVRGTPEGIYSANSSPNNWRFPGGGSMDVSKELSRYSLRRSMETTCTFRMSFFKVIS